MWFFFSNLIRNNQTYINQVYNYRHNNPAETPLHFLITHCIISNNLLKFDACKFLEILFESPELNPNIANEFFTIPFSHALVLNKKMLYEKTDILIKLINLLANYNRRPDARHKFNGLDKYKYLSEMIISNHFGCAIIFFDQFDISIEECVNYNKIFFSLCEVKQNYHDLRFFNNEIDETKRSELVKRIQEEHYVLFKKFIEAKNMNLAHTMYNNNTALIHAIMKKQRKEIISLMLRHPTCKVFHKNKLGRTALDYAYMTNNLEVIKLIGEELLINKFLTVNDEGVENYNNINKSTPEEKKSLIDTAKSSTGLRSFIEHLEKYPDDINLVEESSQLDLLMLVIKFKRLNKFDYLLKKGQKVNIAFENNNLVISSSSNPFVCQDLGIYHFNRAILQRLFLFEDIIVPLNINLLNMIVQINSKNLVDLLIKKNPMYASLLSQFDEANNLPLYYLIKERHKPAKKDDKLLPLLNWTVFYHYDNGSGEDSILKLDKIKSLNNLICNIIASSYFTDYLELFRAIVLKFRKFMREQMENGLVDYWRHAINADSLDTLKLLSTVEPISEKTLDYLEKRHNGVLKIVNMKEFLLEHIKSKKNFARDLFYEDSLYLYVLIVMYSDQYLKIRKEGKKNTTLENYPDYDAYLQKQNSTTINFFELSVRLPMELQAIIAGFAFNLTIEFFLTKDVNRVSRKIFEGKK
jgi:hypothetical protein